MKFLIAPDSFKGSITASEVCTVLAKVAQSRNHIAQVLPLADGGEGSLDAISSVRFFYPISTSTTDATGKHILAKSLYDQKSQTAMLELARTAGLHQIDTRLQNCTTTTTFGAGTQIKHLMALGAKQLILFVGGTATNDAGIGIAEALGFQFLDKRSKPLRPIGYNLQKVAHIIPPNLPFPKDLSIEIATDVTNPFCGPSGAACQYAAQKGASPEEITMLDRGMQHFAQILEKDYNFDKSLAGSGAAGGVAGTLVALLDARIISGAEKIFEITRFAEQLQQNDWLITGEGCTDIQTLQGKLVGRAINEAQKQKIPTALLSGSIQLSDAQALQLGASCYWPLAQSHKQIEKSIRNPKKYLRERFSEFLDSI
ncbi:MAG: hypothetical protein RIS47_2132 [Bacteroidota bacterium]|jgi:glycerate kinase